MDFQEEYQIKTDFFGRVRNLSLPANPYNALVPLYEATMNAIQAIEDKYGANDLGKGNIVIDIVRDDDTNFIKGFMVADNGIGLDDKNFKSFLITDTDNKIKRGGKGVGRLSWLKTFKNTNISSVFLDEGKYREMKFDFRLDKNSQIKNFEVRDVKGHASVTGTIVRLNPFDSIYGNVCPKNGQTIAMKLISHFLSFFVNYNVPKIILMDEEEYSLNDIASEIKNEEVEYEINIPDGENVKTFKLNCFQIPKKFSDDESGSNAVYYVANGRAVKRVVLDNALGLKIINGSDVYCGCVSGKYCDDTANQERTIFNWSDDFFKELHSEVVTLSKQYLKSEIDEVRREQANTIVRVGKEHLRFLALAREPEKFAEKLALNVQSEEAVFLEMSRAALRQYKVKKRGYTKAIKSNIDVQKKASEFTSQLQSEAISSLAECVWKRKLILDLMDKRMEYLDGDDQKRALESAVHEVICPLNIDSEELSYEDHNLWIIDDSLAFFSYFGSDQSFKKTTHGKIDSAKRPDLLFFDQSLGFEWPKSGQPITIIEFKRPGRDDYSISDNPITQVRNYVEIMRKKGAAISDKGREIRAVTDETNFHCHIIADIDDTLKAQIKQFGPFHKRAGSNSYYKWDSEYKTFIQISSYQEMISGAKARHEYFFEKLGING